LTTGALPTGTYVIGYSFEADYNSHKDKVLLHRLTGDYAGVEFSESISAAQTGYFKSRFYSFPKTVTEGASITHGIEFVDPQGTNGFVINFADVSVHRVT